MAGRPEEAVSNRTRFYLVGIATVLVVEFLVRAVFLPSSPSEHAIGLALVVEWVVLLGLLVVWLPRVEGRGLKSIGFTPFRAGHLLTGLLAYVIIFPVTALAGLGLETIGLEGLRSLGPMLSGYSAALLFGLFITGAFLEEVIYRGYLIERLIVLTGRGWLAGLISWISFNLVHLRFFGVGPTLEASVLSAGLTILYLKKRTIWPVIVVHGINNLLAYLVFPLLVF